ncbi:MAG: hypothetical protein HOP28_09520 [Gemmatimonadales bacterium]|nr:hypothetical protein [Gemmatimonadales bacterium]
MKRFLRHLALAAGLAIPAAGRALAQVPDLAPLEVNVNGGKYLNDSKTILIPTVNLYLAIEGTAWSTGKSQGNNVKTKGKYAVRGIDKAWAQGLSRQIHDDLVGRLKAEGYTVLTYGDIKGDENVVSIGRRKADEHYPLPKVGDKVMTIDYLLAAPSDEQAFKPPLQGPHWAFRGAAKGHDAVVLIPEYWILTPQMWGEKEEGYKRVSTSINIAPGMNLRAAWIWFINPKAAGGTIQTKSETRNVTETAGTVSETGSNEIDAGWLKQTSASWKMTIDPTAYGAGVLRAAGAVNKAVIEAMKKENAKG